MVQKGATHGFRERTQIQVSKFRYAPKSSSRTQQYSMISEIESAGTPRQKICHFPQQTVVTVFIGPVIRAKDNESIPVQIVLPE